jgi:hypothetical protein
MTRNQRRRSAQKANTARTVRIAQASRANDIALIVKRNLSSPISRKTETVETVTVGRETLPKRIVVKQFRNKLGERLTVTRQSGGGSIETLGKIRLESNALGYSATSSGNPDNMLANTHGALKICRASGSMSKQSARSLKDAGRY